MKRINKLKSALVNAAANADQSEYIGLLLEYYADRVDGAIQSKLEVDLMTRYVETSRLLEEKNKQLIRSDLRRREAQYKAMLGDWEFDPVTQAVEWSESMYDILEYDRTIVPTTENFFNRVHPEDVKRVQRITTGLTKGIIPKQRKFRMLMPDGRIKWVRVLYTMREDWDGSAEAIRGTVQDITEEKLLEDKLKLYNTHLEEMVQEKVKEIAEANIATIYALVKLSESRDDDTGNHIERTSFYCRLLAEELLKSGSHADEIDDDFIHSIAMASPLHDIGKVGIPDAILLKPGKLTHEEFEIMKTHVILGHRTLASLEKRYPTNSFLHFGMDIARYHHEKWDGTGYMEGLAGENIPLPARIMALADVYDALRSRRVYKEPFSHDKALEIIQNGRGTHFDPALVDIFSTIHHKFQEIYDRMA